MLSLCAITTVGFPFFEFIILVLIAAVAVEIWQQQSGKPFRFRFRTLLIATTLFALVLGIIVWMSRAG
jgi:hypothetical protein